MVNRSRFIKLIRDLRIPDVASGMSVSALKKAASVTVVRAKKATSQ